MNFDLLKSNISRFITMSNAECEYVAQFFYPKTLNKKEHLLNIGEVCTEVAFISKGCLRYYYANDGTERTGQFFFENSWMTDYESWLTKQPSPIGIDAVEKTELMVISFKNLESLYDTMPKFERLGRLMAENTIIGIRKRNLSLLNDSPEERYLKLLKERPKVMARIPQHMIASFLGIEPESLSRIRKKISEKK